MPKHYYRHRHYKNAVPMCEFIEHAPTDAQMDALQEAKRVAEKDARKNGQYGWGKVLVRDGSGCYAAVQWSPGHSSSSIWYNNSASTNGMCFIKQWSGVPEWDDAPPPAQHHPQHSGETVMGHRIPGGRVDVRAAPDQAHVIYEDIHLFKQRRIHTHHLPDQQIEHGEAESVSVEMAATQVNVQHAEQPFLGRHESSHGWLRGFVDRLVNAQPSVVRDRGQLHALPSRAAAPALPAPQTRPMPVSAVPQIAHQPEPQFEAPRERSWAKAILGD